MPTPNTLSSSWPNCSTFGVRFPSRMSMRCPAPNRWCALAVQPERPSRAASARGPCRPTTRAAPGRCRSCRRPSRPGRSRRAAAPGGTRPSRTARASRRGAARACAGGRRSPGRVVDHAALLHDVGEAVGEPGGRGQAVATRAAGLLVVALDRLRQVEVGDEPHVGLVDAHAEGDRRDHDDAVLAQEARLVARRGSVRRARRGTAAPGCPARRGTRRSARPTCARGSRRCPRRPRARCAAARGAGGAARSSARCGTGCWAGRSWRRSAPRPAA